MIRIVAFAAALLMAACSVKHVTAVKPPAETQTGGNSYTDLLPGTTVRIVLPLLEEGKSVKFETPAQPGTITVHGIAGYRIVRYAVVGDANGVQLRFASSEASRDGKTTREEKPPRLPFALPRGTKHIRLVYMIRLSHADHNMAIVAARRLDRLDAFTEQLNGSPDVCGHKRDVFCCWVPNEIAVRPED